MAKAHVKKGDTVIVISGDADKFDESGNLIRIGIKGKTGKVLKVLPNKALPGHGRVIVEGVNFIKKHQKKTQTEQGGIVEREGPLPLAKVKPVTAPAKEKKPGKKAAKPAAKKQA